MVFPDEDRPYSLDRSTLIVRTLPSTASQRFSWVILRMCGAGRRKSASGCDRIVAADFRPKLARRSWCRRRRGRAGTRPDHPPGSELDDRWGVLGNSRRRVDDDQLHVASAESVATRPQPAPQGGRTCRAASSDRRKAVPAGGARLSAVLVVAARTRPDLGE